MTGLPQQVDLLVLGSGAGGMTAALTGALEGMTVLLVEKLDVVGGTTARSAGSLWLPGTHLDPNDDDCFARALTYLRAAVGNGLDEDRSTAFLRAAPQMVKRLETEAGLRLRAYPHHPDYLADLDGATLSGRVLEPEPFDGSVLGRRFAEIAPPLPEFTLFGGMMVDRTDIGHLLQMTRSARSFLYSTRLMARYGLDRVRQRRGQRLVMGNALVGRLYHALVSNRVPVAFETETTGLHCRDGRITHATLMHQRREHPITVNAGVVLATGGFSRDPALRTALLPEDLDTVSAVAEGATGDGLQLAKRLGARFSANHESQSFWAPVSHRRRADGSTGVFPHFVLDRGKPGAFAVGPDGKRFVNEATTYHRFGEALLAMKKETGGGACHLICSEAFVRKYGLGTVRPRGMGLKAAVADGYLKQAHSLQDLAQKIGTPADALKTTSIRHDQFAGTGADLDFGKGSDAYQRNLGDPSHRPNPCLGALGAPPYYALELRPGDIGASAGLVCDASARVLRKDGEPIQGLYACGADMESIMAGRYPGPGITLGPAMTFGYLAAVHAASTLQKASL